MSTTTSLAEPPRPAVTPLPVVEVTIPVYNEERALAASIERLTARSSRRRRARPRTSRSWSQRCASRGGSPP